MMRVKSITRSTRQSGQAGWQADRQADKAMGQTAASLVAERKCGNDAGSYYQSVLRLRPGRHTTKPTENGYATAENGLLNGVTHHGAKSDTEQLQNTVVALLRRTSSGSSQARPCCISTANQQASQQPDRGYTISRYQQFCCPSFIRTCFALLCEPSSSTRRR